MVAVTSLSGKKFYINPHQIEVIENNPDTTLVMVNGKRLVVHDSAAQVVDAIIEYRRKIGMVAAVSEA